MKKVLLLFGAGGLLGRNAIDVFSKKDFDLIYLFSSREITSDTEQIKYIQTKDLSIEENVEDAFRNVKSQPETTFYLYSTIGGFAGGNEIMTMDYKEWNEMFTLNLNISFHLSKYFFKLCKENNGGSLCFTSAMTSVTTAENKAAYGTSKSALNYLVRTLAKEGKNYNISVNAVAPLALDSSENREWVKDESMLISPKAIAEVVFSLFSHRKIVSGNIIELPASLIE
jgi:NAD(P)-dependent dehydrogenase (short-subunit alcohol dehydrogenase family)